MERTTLSHIKLALDGHGPTSSAPLYVRTERDGCSYRVAEASSRFIYLLSHKGIVKVDAGDIVEYWS